MRPLFLDSTGAPTSLSDRALNNRVDDTAERELPIWCMRRGADELRCAAMTTSFGEGLAIVLCGELILFQLEPDAETLVDKAERLAAQLLQRGWVQANGSEGAA